MVFFFEFWILTTVQNNSAIYRLRISIFFTTFLCVSKCFSLTYILKEPMAKNETMENGGGFFFQTTKRICISMLPWTFSNFCNFSYWRKTKWWWGDKSFINFCVFHFVQHRLNQNRIRILVFLGEIFVSRPSFAFCQPKNQIFKYVKLWWVEFIWWLVWWLA